MLSGQCVIFNGYLLLVYWYIGKFVIRSIKGIRGIRGFESIKGYMSNRCCK